MSCSWDISSFFLLPCRDSSFDRWCERGRLRLRRASEQRRARTMGDRNRATPLTQHKKRAASSGGGGGGGGVGGETCCPSPKEEEKLIYSRLVEIASFFWGGGGEGEETQRMPACLQHLFRKSLLLAAGESRSFGQIGREIFFLHLKQQQVSRKHLREPFHTC